MLEYAKNELFQGIEEEEFERMLQCCKARTKVFGTNSYIFSQESKPQYLFILKHGKVNLLKTFPSGKRNILYQIHENEVFGENFFFASDDIYGYDALAVECSEVLMIPYQFVYNPCSNVCEHHKKMIYNLLNIQSKNNLKMLAKLQIVSNTTIRQKIALWLFNQYNSHSTIPVSMNREELAEYLGVTRPSLSRTLMEMQKMGWIRIQGKEISILDLGKLESLFDD